MNYTFNNTCPQCHKPLTYVGDPPWPDGWVRGQEPFCTCGRNLLDHNDWSYPAYRYVWYGNYQYGWICPRCNKVNAPHINSCDCGVKTTFTITAK